MIRKCLVLILVLGFLHLTWSSSGGSCKDGSVFNPKKRECEPQPPTEPPDSCRPGTYWVLERKSCIKLRQVISGYFPAKPEMSTQNLRCPKGFISLRNLCVKELKNKNKTQGSGKNGIEVDMDDKYKIVIKEKQTDPPPDA
ncbi:uncharacterized protein LOC27208293 [Drosophila simulans]|uniref:Seminal fluid protein n=1 Tax=Drosophila simulans TaxID=7240 RepID=A0A0J9RD39_DROSI|nr:uncharacterized protein LOC27208293 [Drosophila simulans]KMY93912.1 uncharacterized protein Dsimw501_GD28445 [Drosophila simulans]